MPSNLLLLPVPSQPQIIVFLLPLTTLLFLSSSVVQLLRHHALLVCKLALLLLLLRLFLRASSSVVLAAATATATATHDVVSDLTRLSPAVCRHTISVLLHVRQRVLADAARQRVLAARHAAAPVAVRVQRTSRVISVPLRLPLAAALAQSVSQQLEEINQMMHPCELSRCML